MSEATKTQALSLAVALLPGSNADEVLDAARSFAGFIEGGVDAKPAAAKLAATKPAATGTAKPAAKKTAPPAEDEETVVTKAVKKKAAAVEAEDAEEGGEVTQEQVETVIADLLGANMRKQAVALLAEYDAKNASGVPEESRAEFVQRAGDMLLGS